MKKRMIETGKIITGIVLLFGMVLSGCGGGGSSTASTTATPVTRTLSWAPPSAYQDNSPLDAIRDLAGYNIYIKSESADFSDSDIESAIASPADTSLDLIPVCNLQGLSPGTYHVSIRAIANNGLMSDFSPTASFTL